MTETTDIVIVGGGIIGMCAAVQLARRSREKIIVLEKGGGPGEGSTGASSAVCRFRYTRPELVRLAKDGINAYQNWSAFLNIDEPLARYHQHGVLWFSGATDDWAEREAKRLSACAIRAETLDDQSLRERYPAISPCIIAPDLTDAAPHECHGGGRHLLEVEGGYFDPVDAVQDLVSSARRYGVDVRFRCETEDVLTASGEITGVKLKSGERIDCGALVNAAGPWCNHLYARAGLVHSWPLIPTRVQMVHIDRPESVIGHIPVCVDLVSGVYFRTQNNGRQFILGSVLEKDERERVEDPGDYARHIDDDFARAKLHALHHRIRGLSYKGKITGYSGLYTVNLADVHPVVGRTAIDGFFVANGFSGHGFKLAPAIGSLLAQAITGARSDFDTDVSPDFLSFDREPVKLESKSVLA